MAERQLSAFFVGLQNADFSLILLENFADIV